MNVLADHRGELGPAEPDRVAHEDVPGGQQHERHKEGAAEADLVGDRPRENRQEVDQRPEDAVQVRRPVGAESELAEVDHDEARHRVVGGALEQLRDVGAPEHVRELLVGGGFHLDVSSQPARAARAAHDTPGRGSARPGNLRYDMNVCDVPVEAQAVRRESRIQLAIVGLVVAIGLVWPSIAGYYTDWLWFGETGYQQVFLTSLLTRLGLGAAVALTAFMVLFGNFRLALRHFEEPYLVLGLSPADGTPIVLQRRGVSHLVTLASALAAAAAGRAGVEPLDGLAAVPQRDQLRRSRPGLRPGRGFLRVPAAVARLRARRPARHPGARPGRLDAHLPAAGARSRAVLRRALRRAPRGAPPPLAPGGGGPAAAGRRDLARRLQPPGVSGRHHPGRDIRRRHRAAAGAPPAWRRRGGRRRDGGHAGVHAPAVAGARRVPALRRDLGRGPHLRHGVPAPGRHAERTGEGGAVHRAQHRGHAQGLCPEQRRGARAVGRRAALEGGYRGKRRHDRQRPALGPAAAARHLRADAGDPHVLRLRVGGRRPLRHQRPATAR